MIIFFVTLLPDNYYNQTFIILTKNYAQKNIQLRAV